MLLLLLTVNPGVAAAFVFAAVMLWIAYCVAQIKNQLQSGAEVAKKWSVITFAQCALALGEGK